MKVLEPRAGMLSNQEVLTHIVKMKERNTQALEKMKVGAMKAENLETVLKETREYLQTKPCATQSPEHVEAVLAALSVYGLEKAELLNIVNERPATLPELYCIVEEISQRFSDDETQEMLAIVKRELPEPPAEGGDVVMNGTS